MKKTSTTGKVNVFQPIVDTVHNVTGLPVSIWIPDKNREKISIVASVGLPTTYVNTATLNLNKSGVVSDAFNKNKIQKIPNIEAEPRWIYKKQAREMNWKSAICVPIEASGIIIGVVSVYAYTERAISELVHTLPNFAKQAALTLEAGRQKEILQKILDINEEIQLMNKNPKKVLDIIVKGACELTGADCAVLYPYDAEQDEFYDIKKVASYGLQKEIKLSEKPRSKGGMAAYTKRRGEVVLSDIMVQDPDMLKTSPFIKREKIRAFMGIALQVSGKALGILYVDFRTPHFFNKNEKEALKLFAHQAAIVINNANLYQNLDSRATALTKLHKVTPRLISISPTPKNLKSLLIQIARNAHVVLGADLVDLYQYNQSEDEFELPPVQLGRRYDPFVIKDKIHRDDIVRAVIGKGPQYVINAQEEKTLIQPFKVKRPDGPSDRFVIREQLQSVASIPLAVGTELVGMLFANYRSPQTFSQQQKELIELFAGQAAIAIYNSRLYQQAKQQSEILKRLQSIGIDLVSLSGTSESLRSILGKIARSAQEVLGADLVDFYQYFENLDDYDLPPVQVGKRFAPNIKKEEIQKDDVIWSIVKSKHPRYIFDSQGNRDLNTPFAEDRTGLPVSRFVIREEIKSTAAVPLLVGKEVVGALFANYRTPQTFSSQQRDLIELFAAQAAIAIHNSRLYWESLQRSKRLELVSKVATALSSSTDIKTILQLAVDGLARVVGVKQSAVALFDEAGESANILVEYLEPGCVSAMGQTIPLRNNPQIDKIIDTKQPLIVDDVQSDPSVMANTRYFLAKRKTLSLMVVPIIIDDEVVGTIGVDAVGQKRHFTVEEAELAQAIADQAATALSIAKQLDQRLNDIHALQDITEQMHQGDLKAVLNLIAERAVELTSAERGGVWLINKTRTALEFGGLANKTQHEQMPPDIRLDMNSENSFSKWVVLNGRSYISGNVREDKNYKPWYEDTYSELTVPITYQDRVIGTINVESPIENRFTEDHKRLIEAMAGQAAIVVQNARLLERLNVLDDIGVELTSGIRLNEDEILESIYSQVRQLTGAQDMYIALYNEGSKEIRFPLATKKGKRVKYQARKADMDKRGKTEEIIFTRKPILHKTKKEAENWYGQPGHEEKVGLINPSWLGVPMMVGERVIGVIAIYDLEQENAYDKQDLQVFSSMASQAAFSLVNQELNRRNVALASLNDIGRELTSGIRLKAKEILELIFIQTQELTGAKDLYIALYDEGTGEIRFPLATEKGKSINYPSRKANMGKRGKTEEIIFTREPILHKTLREAQEWYSQFGHSEFIGKIQPSWLGVPMMVGERVLGVIAAIDLEKEFAYDELHLDALTSMASQAAIALDNANLYYNVNQKLENANQQLETILSIINAAEINADLHEFLQNILKDLLGRINIKNGTIQLYDPKRGELIIWAKVGNVINPSYQHVSLKTGLTGKAAKEKRSIYVPDVRSSPEYVDYMSDTLSEYVTPMLIGDILIGVLNVEDPLPDAISLYHRQLIELLGNQIAILIRQKLIMRGLEEKKLVDQVNESLGLVTAEVAHKVGNTAGKIRFLARERLQDAPNINPSQRKDIQIILRNVEDMIRATDDLFKPFGMEPKVEITVEEMIRVAIGQCATPKNIKIFTKFEADLPKVNVQVTKVQSYLTELLINAIKYTMKGMARKNARSEKVEIIGQRSKDGFVEIVFTNHGPAIPSEDWESIFRVFSARGQKSEDDQSYGLGLWGTRATMQQQGGDVFLLESDDKKTTFVVRFSLA